MNASDGGDGHGASAAQAAVRWHRPPWSGARLRPRWLALSVALHAGLIAGLASSGWWRTRPEEGPHLALHRVLGATPAPPREPPPARVEVEVRVEEELLVELLPEPPAAEPAPIEWPGEPPPQVVESVERPRHRPGLTVIRRIAPTPAPTAAAAPAPTPPPAADPGATVAPVPIDEVNTPPRYPPRAIALRQEGKVWLRVTVAADGQVLDCRVRTSSGYALLDRAAETAVWQWRFRDGPGEILLPIEFVLRLLEVR